MPHKLTNETDSLLVHILRDQDIFMLAYQYLQPAMLSGDYLFSQRVIWAAARDLYEQLKTMPQRHTLSVEVSRRLDEGGMGDVTLTAKAREDALGLIDAIYDFPTESLVPPFAKGHLQRVIDKAQIKPMAERIKDSTTSDELAKHIEGLSTAFRSTRLFVPTETSVITSSTLNALRVVRIPTVDYVDHLLNGGIIEGHVYGIIGGSGGGKTTISMHMLCTLALKGYHVNLFTYEQALGKADADMQRRIYSCAGRIKRSVVSDLPFDNWSVEDKEKARVMEEKVKPFLHTYDMTGSDPKMGNGGVVELEGIMRQDQLMGRKAILNVIDWCLPMLKRYMSAKRIDEKFLGSQVDNMVNTCKNEYAAKYGGCWWIVNQLASAEVSGPGHKPRQQDSAGAKNLSWLCDHFFALGSPTEDGYMTLVIDKNRGWKRGHTSIQFDPDYEMMKWHSSKVYDARNKSGFVEVGSEKNKLPDEKPEDKGEGLAGT